MLTLPKFTVSFDSTSLASFECESSTVEQNFIKLLVSALLDENLSACQMAAKFIIPDMISDIRYRDIYENILQEPNIQSLTVKLNGGKSIIAGIIQEIQEKNIKFDTNIFLSLAEQIKEFYLARKTINRIQNLHKYHTLDKIFYFIESIKEDMNQNIKIDASIHPLTIGCLEPEDLEHEMTWLVPDIIFPQSINLFFAPPSHGKSFLIFTLGIELLKRNLIDHLIYLDGDNPLVILKHRKIDKALKLFNTSQEKRIIYHNPASAETMQRLFENVINFPGKNLIVVDSLKDLAGNLNLNDQRDSTYLQNLIQRVRNGCKNINTNTIIILHHENKQRDIKGNGVFMDGADCAYQITTAVKKFDGIYLNIVNKKARIPVKAYINLKVYFNEYKISEILSKNENQISIKHSDKDNVNAILLYLQKKYEMGIKKIPLNEISKKLNISERKLKSLGEQYIGLWSFENNYFIPIVKRDLNEISLWKEDLNNNSKGIFN